MINLKLGIVSRLVISRVLVIQRIKRAFLFSTVSNILSKIFLQYRVVIQKPIIQQFRQETRSINSAINDF